MASALITGALMTSCGAAEGGPDGQDPGSASQEGIPQAIETRDSRESINELVLLPSWVSVSPQVDRVVTGVDGFSLDVFALEIARDRDADDLGFSPTDTIIPLPHPDSPGQIPPSGFPALIKGNVFIPDAPGSLRHYDLIRDESIMVSLPGGRLNSVAYDPGVPGTLALASPDGVVGLYRIDEKVIATLIDYTRPVRVLGFSSAPQPAESADEAEADADEENGDPEVLLEILSSSGWFALIDPVGGVELFRSLDLPGFRSAASSGDGYLARSSANLIEIQKILLTEAGEIAIQKDAELRIPWRFVTAMAFDDGKIVGSSPSFEADSQLLFSLDPLNLRFDWIVDIPFAVDAIALVGEGAYRLDGDGITGLYTTESGGEYRQFTLDGLSTLILPDEGSGFTLIGIEDGSDASLQRPDAEYGPSRIYRLPDSEVSKNFSVLAENPSEQFLQDIHRQRHYRISFEHQDLPVEIALDMESRSAGRFTVESERQVLIRILDRNGSEILSSLDKVSLEPELAYELSRGSYRLVLEDAGGETDADFFVLQHELFR
jgi:hypothetical protein